MIQRSFSRQMTAVADEQNNATANSLTNRARFLAACACQPVDRPPVWLMRQAGRALPEYRKLKEKYSFLELVQTPELAAEVTIQPIRRFDFDAAILFSDILVVAEALGQPYRFREGGGIEMEFTIRTAQDIERLKVEAVTERLQYIPQALKIIRKNLGDKTALIGFAGSPWTLANFMLEGGSAKEFTKAKSLLDSDPKLFAALMEKLTAAVTRLLQMQIEAGVDAVQIFDSLGGILPVMDFQKVSGDSIKKIIAALGANTPLILFSKGTNDLDALLGSGAQVLGFDSAVKLADIRARLPKTVAVQGNLDPSLLATTPEKISVETNRILTEMRGARGHIFNLGHGVPPDAKLENIAALVETVRNFK